MTTAEAEEFVRVVAAACRAEGVRRARFGEVELELAVVANPLLGDKPAAPSTKETDPRLRNADHTWGDALGRGGIPVIKQELWEPDK